MRFLKILLIVFLFFPFVGVIPGIDVQPLFFLYGSSLLTFLSLFKIKVPRKALITLITLFTLFFLRFFFELEHLNFRYISTYLISISTPFLIYTFIINDFLVINKRVVFYVLAIYLSIGAIQLYEPDFLAWLVSRSVDQVQTLVRSGRGVRSLASEPSNFGKLITGLNILLIFFFLRDGKKSSIQNSINVSFLLVFLNAILAQSAYSVGFHLIFIFIYMLCLRKAKYLFWYGGFLGILFIGYEILLYGLESRLIKIFSALFNNPEFLMQQGAFKRLMNVPISIKNISFYGFLGAGNNPSTYYSSIYVIIGEYKYLASNRNLGGFIEYFLKFGLFSTPFYMVYTVILYRISRVKTFINNRKYNIGIFLSLALFIYSFQDGSPVNPITWFMILYIYHYRNDL